MIKSIIFSLFSLSTIASIYFNFKSNNTLKMNDFQIIKEEAYFGAGCFWCTEAIFQQVNGVIKVESGYSGGNLVNPTYEDICNKNTNHAEVVKITFNSKIITYDQLLEFFWQTHDPTTLNKQGADIGTQYRSIIFFTNIIQKQKAEDYKNALNKSGAFEKPIVTIIEPIKKFYPAEAYHQNYYINNTSKGYCQFVIKPKIEKFKKVFKQKLKDKIE